MPLGMDPDYLKKVKEIEEMRDKRLFTAETFLQYELQCAKEDFEREKSVAMHEIEVETMLATFL